MKKLRLRAAWLIVAPFLWWSMPTPGVLVAGALVAAFGLVVRAWAAGTIRKGEELTTTGPYAFTRNPLYVGTLFIGVGAAIAGGQWTWPAVFIVFFAALYPFAMRVEARRLEGTFPDRYARYAREVPGFVPRLTPYRDGAMSVGTGGFRWSQYHRNREWEASLGALAVFGLLAAKIVWL